MLNYRKITAKSTYVNKSWELVKKVEGVRYDVYADSLGYASIGVGFNLMKSNVRAAVYSELGIKKNYDDATISALEQDYIRQLDDVFSAGSTQLQADLNAIMLARAKDKRYTVTDISRRPTFTFSPADTGMTEMRDVFNQIFDVYDGFINSKIGTVPLSDERVALFSLAYNSSSLLGGKLQHAIKAGDRAEAWFEIRYHSNKENGVPLETRKGLQKRRYLEANMFSLYNKTPTEDDYKAAYRMFPRHRDDVLYSQNGMIAYDKQFAGALAIATGQNSTVGILKDELAPAYTYLINTYAAGTGIGIDWRDVTVAEEDGAIVTGVIRNGDAYGTGTEVNDLIIGGKGIDVLLGEGGDDILIGGKGNDILDGGASGHDYLKGGAGHDTYYVSAGDAVEDSDNDGIIIVTLDDGTEYTLTGGRLVGGNYVSDDYLDGGEGNDRLVGDDGNPDSFTHNYIQRAA